MRVSELRGAREDSLGPVYSDEREVCSVGACLLFVAVGPPNDPGRVAAVIAEELSLAVDAGPFEREVLLLAGGRGGGGVGARLSRARGAQGRRGRRAAG